MERVEQMIAYLEEDMDNALINRMEKMKKQLILQEGDWKKEFAENIYLLDENGKGRIVISYLLSSYITESYKFRIAFYSGIPFVEEEPPEKYISLRKYMEPIRAEEINQFRKKLCRQYIRIWDWEIEEIRRKYMKRLYESCEEVFRSLVENLQLHTLNAIYYGAYMGTLILL